MKRKGHTLKQKVNKTKTSMKSWFHWWHIPILIGAVLILAYLGVTIFYMSHFFKGTKINYVDCSNMTVEQADAEIKKEAKNYVLTLEERGDLTEKIKGSDFELVYVLEGSLEDIIKEQNAFLWVYGLFADSEKELPSSVQYNAEKFDNLLNSLSGMQKENMKKPVNAKISSYLETEKKYEIIPEDEGALIIKDTFIEKCKEAVQFLKPNLSLDEEGCYKGVTIKKDSVILNRLLKSLNKYVGAEITYQFGDKTEVLDGSIIQTFLRRRNKSNKITLSEKDIKEYIRGLARRYDTFGKIRRFKTSSGKQITISRGDYGWWMNQAQEFKELKKLIEEGKRKTRKPVYYQKAASYGENDYGNTYVEINLRAQHMYFYKNGKMILETDVVTGNPYRDNATPTGIYGVMYKQHGATLVGEDYETPVEFWMPFYNDVGMHDATWRSSFGGNIYRGNGSHGCINMPYAKAKELYGRIDEGTPVICY